MTVVHFVVELMNISHARMKQALDGLTDDQLLFQPSEGSNPIGWLVWHLSRWKDIQTASAAGEQTVWVTSGWTERFGLPESASGYGDTPEEVAASRANHEILLGYAEAVHKAATQRVLGLSSERLVHPIASVATGEERPVWRALSINALDYMEHTGQIAYLRGMLTGPGWL